LVYRPRDAIHEEEEMGVHQDAMRREMQLRGFAARTQRTYTNWMKRLVREVRLPADQVTEEQARAFLSGLAGRGLSASTVNQAISAVRFFFEDVLRRSWDLELRYQREPQRVPVTLTPEEVSRLLEAVPTCVTERQWKLPTQQGCVWGKCFS
jgi:site-specific recombinase XerD